MPSERQIEANRRNGAKGGPKTEEGKERSRVNSLKHGLTAASIVTLPEEDEQEYQELLASLRESLNPVGAAEDALVVRLSHAQWRSLRSRRIEVGILHIVAGLSRGMAREEGVEDTSKLNPHEAIGVGYMVQPQERFDMFLRYDAAISREYFRTMEALLKLQRFRVMQERHAAKLSQSKTAKPKVMAAASGAPAPVSENGIGSVSQGDPVASEAPQSKEIAGPQPETRPQLQGDPASQPDTELACIVTGAPVNVLPVIQRGSDPSTPTRVWDS